MSFTCAPGVLLRWGIGDLMGAPPFMGAPDGGMEGPPPPMPGCMGEGWLLPGPPPPMAGWGD